MPELPEVERARTLTGRVCVGRTIVRVECETDDKVFELSTSKVRKQLLGRRVVAAHRKGKYLWLELSQPPHLVVHLGMSGSVQSPGVTKLELGSERYKEKGDAWPPAHTKLRLILDDDSEWAMTNRRRFGRLLFRENPETETPLSKLGPDAMNSLPSAKALFDNIHLRRSPLKTILLDQSLVSGVGNWIADDVLLRARLSPLRKGTSISLPETKRLRTAVRHVISTAIARNAEGDAFPRTWLFHGRWKETQNERTSAGEKIERIRIGGRTTLWVPQKQS